MLSRHSTLLTWSALFDLLIAFEYFTKLKKWYFLFSYPPISCKKKLYFISPSKFLQFWFDHKLLVRLAYMVLITNCQGLLYIGIINSIELVSSSARVTSTKFQKDILALALGPIDRTREYLGPVIRIFGN